MIAAVTDETEDAAVSVVGIDPLETVPVVIQFVERRVFAVELQ